MTKKKRITITVTQDLDAALTALGGRGHSRGKLIRELLRRGLDRKRRLSAPGEDRENPIYEGPAYGIRDPQRQRPSGVCPHCGGELWQGEPIYRVEGENLCAGCFRDWVGALAQVRPQLVARQLGADPGREE